MRGITIAVFAVLLAVAAARHCQKPNNPVGTCPLVDGESPVYLMDELYRGVFYECNSGKPVRMNCPKGLVFDPRLNVCNYPSNEGEAFGPVGTCPNRDGVFLRYLRDGANMSVFYVCVNGEPRKYNCADGLVFHPILKACFPSV